MKSGRIGVSVSVVLMVSLALGPAAALGDPSKGPAAGAQVAAARGPQSVGGRPGGGGRPMVPHGVGRPPAFSHPPFHQRPFFHPRPFFPRFPHNFHRRQFFGGFGFFPLVTSGGLFYGDSSLYGAPGAYGAGAYGAPAAIYNVYSPVLEINNAPPGAYGAPAPPVGDAVSAPAPPAVVEYASGRYELRGDGMTAPYTWVWIPNPPPGPPGAPPTGGPASGEPSTSRHGQIYRWTDDQGVMHMTDRWDAVPPQYRTQAKPKQPS